MKSSGNKYALLVSKKISVLRMGPPLAAPRIAGSAGSVVTQLDSSMLEVYGNLSKSVEKITLIFVACGVMDKGSVTASILIT